MYHSTVGKIIMFFSETVVRFIRFVFYYTVTVPLKFVWSVVKRVTAFLYRVTFGKVVFLILEKYDSYITGRYLKSFAKKVRFDYIPKKRRKEKN